MTMIHVGVSACVVGDEVRFDGGHKKSGYVANYLSKVFRLSPICPEVAIGMSVPRPAIRLIEGADENLLVDSKDSTLDYTDKMASFFSSKNSQIAQMDGYIVCAKSPTCGMERVKVYAENGDLQHRKGSGVFTARMMKNFPSLPVEEDGRLNDLGLRESFVTRVFAHHRFRKEVMEQPSAKALVAFHSAHKFLVMAYSPQAYQALGRLVAHAGKGELDTCIRQYLSMLMAALSKPTNRKKQTNVLMHLQGFFKKQLSPSDKQELCEQIEKYRLGHVPLMAPVTLLKHFLKQYPNDYISRQVYLDPYPDELELRA